MEKHIYYYIKVLCNNPIISILFITYIKTLTWWCNDSSINSEVSIFTEKCCLLQVRVSNLMGGALGPLTVVADSAKHLRDDAIILSKKPFTAKDE